jgi:hypothetical protein
MKKKTRRNNTRSNNNKISLEHVGLAVFILFMIFIISELINFIIDNWITIVIILIIIILILLFSFTNILNHIKRSNY